MKVVTLEKIPLSTITVCFNKAFSDYFVKFNATEIYLQERWKGAGVDYSLSAGVMDGEELVGLIVNGVREWGGFKTAFNTGTGVIPTHRGNKLTEKMYDFLIPLFIKNGIQSLALEVIQENAKAIHIYEKVGLKIRRGLHCHGGEIKIEETNFSKDLIFKKLEEPNFEMFNSFHDFEPAWDNTNSAILECMDKYSFYGVEKNGMLVSYLILKNENGSIPQFGVHPDFRNNNVGKFLFSNISKVKSEVKINNIEGSSDHVIKFLEGIGIKNVINQFEMVSYL